MTSKKRGAIGVIMGILVLLLFLPLSPSAASSQPGFVLFAAALGAVVVESWALAPALAPVWKKPLLKFTVGTLLCASGAALAIQESVHYRDISPLPLSLGLAVLSISFFAEFGRRAGRRSPLGSEGLSYESYKILAIVVVVAISLFIIGVVIPLIYSNL